jgi:hypothetical protein
MKSFAINFIARKLDDLLTLAGPIIFEENPSEPEKLFIIQSIDAIFIGFSLCYQFEVVFQW